MQPSKHSAEVEQCLQGNFAETDSLKPIAFATAARIVPGEAYDFSDSCVYLSACRFAILEDSDSVGAPSFSKRCRSSRIGLMIRSNLSFASTLESHKPTTIRLSSFDMRSWEAFSTATAMVMRQSFELPVTQKPESVQANNPYNMSEYLAHLPAKDHRCTRPTLLRSDSAGKTEIGGTLIRLEHFSVLMRTAVPSDIFDFGDPLRHVKSFEMFVDINSRPPFRYKLVMDANTLSSKYFFPPRRRHKRWGTM